MRLSTGDRLGPYEITGLIGKGGMGEVYRGTDIRLGRPVAIKVSSREFNDRFEREAKAISALNHPNICTLYDIGPNYLVMEFVEGELLSKIIERGPLPLDKALMYAVQIVDALSAAHAKGIVHRDLKPGNIIITKNGVKVLDFGLARLTTERMPSADADNVETVTEPITRAGAVLGTLYYMAPEQLEAKETDERSDIFSFGIVCYEMITGQRPFAGDTQAATLASLMKDSPLPMNLRQPATPRALERVVRKCLEKKPEDRWRSAHDLKPTLELIDLDAAPMSSASASVPIPVHTPRKSWLWPAIAAALVVIAAAGAWALWPKPAAPALASRFQVTLPDNVDFNTYLSVSPNGHKLVFTASGTQSGIWIRDVDTLEWRHLAGTEGAIAPFWSPDSRFLAFGMGRELKKIEVAGGPAQTICTTPAPAGSGAWSQDGVIVFGLRAVSPIRRVPASGGVPAEVTVLDAARNETFHALPTFLPDGKHFLYLRQGPTEVAGIYAGSLDAKPSEQSRERILATQLAAPYADGKLFFMREGTLMAQSFDASKLKLTGEPAPVAEHVGALGSSGFFSVSPSNVLAYRTGATPANGTLLQAYWFDRQGKLTSTAGEPGALWGLRLSPDATRAAGRDDATGSRGDVWMLDLARGVRTRLTFRQSAGSFPVWSPDGSSIVFSAGGILADTIYERAASGAGEEKELLKKQNESKVPTSWSHDGRFLLYHTPEQAGGDLWVLPLAGDRKPVLLLGTQFTESYGSFSPDGRWVAYASNETGRDEIYVRPFIASGSSAPGASGPRLGEGKWQVSKDGAVLIPVTGPPHWRNDGKELIFIGPNNAVMVVDVNGSGAAFQMGTPKVLFTAGLNNPGGLDVTADDTRFLVTTIPGVGQPTQTPITVVLNWQADLKK